jgi:hypothetical protein
VVLVSLEANQVWLVSCGGLKKMKEMKKREIERAAGDRESKKE